MFKYSRKKKPEEDPIVAIENNDDNIPPIPPPKDIILSPPTTVAITTTTASTASTAATTENTGTYEPLNELELPRDFRTSLILTQFNNDQSTDLSTATTEEKVGNVRLSTLSTLPMPSMPWMTDGTTDSARPPLHNNKSNTTPPLSPTLSCTSETLVRKSSSTRSSDEPWRPPLLLGAGGKQSNKGVKFILSILNIFIFFFLFLHFSFVYINLLIYVIICN